MRQLLLLLVILLATAGAWGTECTRTEGAEAPATWVKAARKDYDEPGAGFSVSFRGKHGIGTVYIYDNGIDEWTDGIADARLRAQIDEVGDGLRELERQGRYADLSIGEPTTRRLHCRDFLFLTITGKLDGRPMRSTASVTVLNGKLFKIRATFYVDPPAGIEVETEALARLALADPALR